MNINIMIRFILILQYKHCLNITSKKKKNYIKKIVLCFEAHTNTLA
jgi:hypothetical protein